MHWCGVLTFLFLCDAFHGFVLTENSTRRNELLKGSSGDEISYQILATTAVVSSSVSSSTQVEKDSFRAKREDWSSLNSFNATRDDVPGSSTTKSANPSTVLSADKPKSSRRMVLEESTFSSMIPVRRVRKQAPARQYRTMLSPKVSTNPARTAATSPSSTPVHAGYQSLFIVSDERGKPILPVKTPSPKGLFEVRDEMGQLVIPPSRPLKGSRPASNNVHADPRKHNFHIQDEDGTPVVSPPAAAPSPVPQSGLSKFTATQQLFKISGTSDFRVPNEILQLSGRSSKIQMKWKDVNGNLSPERYDAHEEPIRVTRDTLSRSQTAASPQTAPPITPETTRVQSPESVQESLPSISDVESHASTSQTDLVVVHDEMGESVDPASKKLQTGHFNTRDDLGNVFNPVSPSPKETIPKENSVPQSGLSKFAATKELFKVSGMSDFAVPSEIYLL
jgi:hypothetical protein